MEITVRNSRRTQRVSPGNIRRILDTAAEILAKTEDPFRKLCGPSADPSLLEISVLLTGDRKMRQLNSTYRGKDATTDVLSFSQLEGCCCMAQPGGRVNLGDIVISLPKAELQAEEYGTGFEEELARLLIHGFLHLLGYDHERGPKEAARMRRLETKILRTAGQHLNG